MTAPLLKIATLQRLRDAAPYGVPAAVMLTHLRVGGHRTLAEPELLIVLRELADASLADRLDTPLGERWRITALGKSELTEAGV